MLKGELILTSLMQGICREGYVLRFNKTHRLVLVHPLPGSTASYALAAEKT